MERGMQEMRLAADWYWRQLAFDRSMRRLQRDEVAAQEQLGRLPENELPAEGRR
jgi:hypothetical protein